MRRRRDIRLAGRILAGDRDAAERWVTEHYPSVYRTLAHLTRTPDAAADLAQQTFVNALDHLGEFAGRSTLRTWLHKIAWREYCHWCRDARPSVDLSLAEPPVNGHDETLAIWLRWALDRLDDEHRTTFVLHEVEGLSVNETAEVLRIPPGTVKSRLHTARRRLRAMLGDEEGDDVAKQ